jgi:predicted ABC-type ATPase
LRTKRLRIFAGPNGSGKSTIESIVSSKYNIGKFINADRIEHILRRRGKLSFNSYRVKITAADLKESILRSGFSSKVDINQVLLHLTISKNVLHLKSKDIPYAYLGAIVSELIRNKCLERKSTFSFETVMSHVSKLDFIREAKARGFKTYLYFVCTESVEINIDRVQSRVELGGHPVPIEKIRSRYKKTLELLSDAVKLADRAFIFDNSEQSQTILLAEKDDGQLKIFVSEVPKWFDTYLIQELSK